MQAVLTENRVARTTGSNGKAPSLLTGLLFDEAGERLTPTWSIKKGTRYRYYVSTSLVKDDGKAHSRRLRIPAGDLENLVIERLRTFFANRGELLDAIEGETLGRGGQGQLIERGHQFADKLSETPDKNRAIVTNLVRRVEFRRNDIKINISRDRLTTLLKSNSGNLPIEKIQPRDPSGRILTLTAPAQLMRVGREMKLLIDDSRDNKAPELSLLKILARAHDVRTRLAQDTSLTVHDIARQERITAGYIYILLRLRWLAPDITTAIINGRQPPQLNAQKLMRLTAQLPADWAEQRALLGFR